MRPEIPEALAKRIDDIYDEAGYANRGELVRDAVRHRLRELEEQVDAEELTSDIARELVVNEDDGIVFGTNPEANQEVIIDRFARPTTSNALFSGDIGSGKSASVKAQIVREARTRDDLNIVLIDPLEGFIGPTLALDGTRTVIGGNVGLNPLEIHPTPDDVLEAANGNLDPYAHQLEQAVTFFTSYLESRGQTTTEAQRGVIERAVQKAYSMNGIHRDPDTHSRESPTPTDVLDILAEMAQNPQEYTQSDSQTEADRISSTAADILVGLYPLAEGGDDANFSRQTEFDPFDSTVTYLDLQHQHEGRTGLIMQLLFTIAFERAKRQDGKTIIVVDEAHYLLHTEGAQSILATAFRHSRHYDTSIVLSGQGPAELITSDAGQTIIDNCSLVQVHHCEAIDEETAEALGMGNDAREFVRHAEPGTSEHGYSEALLRVDGDWLPLHVTLSEAEQKVVNFKPNQGNTEEVTDIDLTSTDG